MTKERYEKYRKLYLAHKHKKLKKIPLKSNSLPIGTVRIGHDGREYRKIGNRWLDIEKLQSITRISHTYFLNPILEKFV